MKKLLCILICGVVAASFVGCASATSQSATDTAATESGLEDTASGDDIANTDNADANAIDSSTNAGTSDVDNAESGNTDVSSSDEIFNKVADIDVSEWHVYSGIYSGIEVLGLKEYTSLGEGYVVDTPGEGNVYLVVYLKVDNKTEEPFYFNPDDLTVWVDGQVNERTYLMNIPDGYDTIFGNIRGNESAEGYFVCEVSKDWQELKYEFKGWEFTHDPNYANVTDTLTPTDLKDPE